MEPRTPAEIIGDHDTNYARAEAFVLNADLCDIYTARSYLMAAQVSALLAIADTLTDPGSGAGIGDVFAHFAVVRR